MVPRPPPCLCRTGEGSLPPVGMKTEWLLVLSAVPFAQQTEQRRPLRFCFSRRAAGRVGERLFGLLNVSVSRAACPSPLLLAPRRGRRRLRQAGLVCFVCLSLSGPRSYHWPSSDGNTGGLYDQGAGAPNAPRSGDVVCLGLMPLFPNWGSQRLLLGKTPLCFSYFFKKKDQPS